MPSMRQPDKSPAFLGWLDDFEHDKLGLPRADLVLYLDMPTRCALVYNYGLQLGKGAYL